MTGKQALKAFRCPMRWQSNSPIWGDAGLGFGQQGPVDDAAAFTSNLIASHAVQTSAKATFVLKICANAVFSICAKFTQSGLTQNCSGQGVGAASTPQHGPASATTPGRFCVSPANQSHPRRSGFKPTAVAGVGGNPELRRSGPGQSVVGDTGRGAHCRRRPAPVLAPQHLYRQPVALQQRAFAQHQWAQPQGAQHLEVA